MSRIQQESCIICHAGQYVTLYYPTNSPGPVVRCANCGFVYVRIIEDDKAIIDDGKQFHVSEEFLTSRDINDLAGCWELSLLPDKQAESAALRCNAFDALDRIKPFRQPPGRLLDFGCGWGFFLGAAREAGWTIHGLEPLPGHAIYARGYFDAEVISDVMRDTTFPPDYFDVVTAFQVFEHLPDPSGDLQRLVDVLKPGGVILIEVPNIDTWGVRLLGKRHRHFVKDHLNFFSPRSLSQLFINHGLNVADVYFPTRRMSYRHLVTAWGGRILPDAMTQPLSELLHKVKLSERTLRMNLGDIVAVIGQKPG